MVHYWEENISKQSVQPSKSLPSNSFVVNTLEKKWNFVKLETLVQRGIFPAGAHQLARMQKYLHW